MSGPKIDFAEIREMEKRRIDALRNERRSSFDKIRAIIKKVETCNIPNIDELNLDSYLKADYDEIIKAKNQCLIDMRKIEEAKAANIEKLWISGGRTLEPGRSCEGAVPS